MILNLISLHTVTAKVIILAAILKGRPQIMPFNTSMSLQSGLAHKLNNLMNALCERSF